METGLKEGKIRAIGVANHSAAQMDEFRQAAPIHAVQVPYKLSEREAESVVVPYARRHNIAVLCHDTLCRGLLTGTITATTQCADREGHPAHGEGSDRHAIHATALPSKVAGGVGLQSALPLGL